MPEFLQIVLAYLPLVTIVTGLTLALLASFTTAMVLPRFLLMGFLAVFASFPNNGGWGLEEGTTSFNIYAKGTKFFVFPALMIMLWGLWISVKFRAAITREGPSAAPITVWLGALTLLVLAHGAVAPLFDQNVLVGLSPRGLMNLVSLGAVVSVMLHTIKTERDLRMLENGFLFVFTLRMVWGLVRFAALGGDPMNAYENAQAIHVRVTFFDVNDSLLATMAIILCAWRIARHGFQRLDRALLVNIFIIGLALVIILFSFRRTAWIGLLLALLVLISSRRWPYRFPTIAAAIFLGVPAIGYVALKRFAQPGYSSRGFLETFAPDVVSGGSLSVHQGRFAELTAAVDGVGQNWLWGLGSWGEFFGRFVQELAYHRGNFGFVHSGFVHMYLKSGLIGLTLFTGLVVSFVVHVLRRRAQVADHLRAPYEASLAGFAFMVPALFVGTPIIEFRTMVLLGVVMGLPFVVLGLQSRAVSSSTGDRMAPARVTNGGRVPA